MGPRDPRPRYFTAGSEKRLRPDLAGDPERPETLPGSIRQPLTMHYLPYSLGHERLVLVSTQHEAPGMPPED